LLALRFIPRGAAWLAVVVAAGVLAWNLTAELAFASASNRSADSFANNLRRPFTWVDDLTGGASTLYIGQQMQDQNGEWLLEFWNRSIRAVESLDGTASQSTGPARTPDPRASDGALSPDPGYPYVVEERGIDIVGTEIASHSHVAGGHLERWRLIRVAPPLRLRAAVTGIFPDGWAGAASAYTRYMTEGGRTGRVRLIVSRRDWGGPNKTGHVTVKIGPVVIGTDNQPHVGMPVRITRFDIHSKEERAVVLKAPGPRFRIEVTIDPTFAPRELSPQTTSDNRQLGAVVRYVFLPPRKAAHK
jgi:hypothetical protein